MKLPRRIALLGSHRIPFCRSVTAYKKLGNKALMTGAMQGLVDKYQLREQILGEVALGAVLKRSGDFSLAREVTLSSGLAAQTPATGIQKACATSLEAAIFLGQKIALGQIESAVAGGCDTSSDVPIELSERFSQRLIQLSKKKSLKERVSTLAGLSPKELIPSLPAVKEPRTGLSMGQHCELMARQWEISREDQDQLAFDSHKKATVAYENGFFKDLLSPFYGVEKDNNLRPDASYEKLAKLKPSFERDDKATLTAGNSSALTDGAACVLLGSEDYAKERSLEPLAYLSEFQSAAVDFENGEGLLMAPTVAVSQMLSRTGLSLQDFDLYEIHEAFAAQVLCTLKAWEDDKYCRSRLGLDKALGPIDRSKLNVTGSSIALGHPFAATGARILGTAAKLLAQKGKGRALISICTAGGMGVVAILER